MADLAIVNAIEQYESEAVRNGDLQSERAKAMDYYLGRPFGNEVTGRSQVVSHDVSDSIEWIKPGIMRAFCSGDDIVSFDPRGPEDVAGAQQESDFVNYIITQKNNWFNCFYIWATDALLQKNGYVKVYWDERQEVEKEKYEGKTDDELALVMQDHEVEIVSHTTRQVPYQTPQGPVLVTVNDFEVQRKKTYGCARFLNIPPERTVVSASHQMVDLQECSFFEHWEYKTISQLREEGFDVDDDIGTDEDDAVNDVEEHARDRYLETQTAEAEDVDPASRRLRVRECWIRFDEDEDGIAELRHVIVTGRVPLLDEECDVIPVAALTPRIMPHRHVGISEADLVMDIQLIKSTLQRGFLDNVYLSINGRHGVDKDKVNLNDMLTSRPGGLVRTTGAPANAIMPLTHQADFASVLKGVEYFDMVREGRTGSSKNTQQINPSVLSQAQPGAVAQLFSAAQAIQELVIRTFAETGVKRLFNLVHSLTQKHSSREEIVRIRNQWIPVDPRQWKTRSDMTVTIGLGSGDKQAQMAHAGSLVDLQLKLMPTGLADRETLHNSLTKLTNAMGYKDTASLWKDPKQLPPQQPPPNPDVIKSQLKIEEKKHELMLKHSLDMAKLQAEMQAEMAKNASQAEQTRIEEEYRMKASVLDAQLEQQLKVLDASLQHERDTHNANLAHTSKVLLAAQNQDHSKATA